MPTPTVENYLKSLLSLTRGSGAAGISQLAQSLSVSTPTANNMVKKLAQDGLVHYERYRPVRLTEQGRRVAALVVRKHRLTEMFLVEKMGFGWEEVHPIAEQIEHIQSPAFFERMDQLMGTPTHDPHGSPIPDREGNIRSESHPRLSECRSGQTVTLVALDHDSNDFLLYLNERDLSLGTQLTIRSVESFDGGVTVAYADREGITLSKLVADKLLVTL